MERYFTHRHPVIRSLARNYVFEVVDIAPRSTLLIYKEHLFIITEAIYFESAKNWSMSHYISKLGEQGENLLFKSFPSKQKTREHVSYFIATTVLKSSVAELVNTLELSDLELEIYLKRYL